MYLNDPNHLQVQDLNAIEANELAMAFINDELIEPMERNNLLDNDALSLLNVVGGALKSIAQKAYAYEKMFDKDGKMPHYYN
jgi:hypothetical protein